MNGKLARKLRQAAKKHLKPTFAEVVEFIEGLPLKARITVAWKIVIKSYSRAKKG